MISIFLKKILVTKDPNYYSLYWLGNFESCKDRNWNLQGIFQLKIAAMYVTQK